MKIYLYAFVSVILLAVTAIYYVNFSNNRVVSDLNNNKQIYQAAKSDLCCVEDLHPNNYSDKSIYQLKSVWKDQNNKEMKLNELYGRQVVLAMIYTSCPTACPVIVNDMQKLEAAIPKKELDNYRFVLISFDPERDTPAQLKKYSHERNLNENGWTLLTGSEIDIAELSQTIGFKYKETKPGLYTHSNLITFLNSRGEIINQSEGLNVRNDWFTTFVNK